MATKKKPEEISEEAVEETAVEAKPAKQKEDQKRLVKIKLFRDNNMYKAPLYVGVNGKTWMIPRGVECEVPLNVYKAAMRSIADDQNTADMLQRMQEDYLTKG